MSLQPSTERLSPRFEPAGKPPLGFLNPLFYANPTAFQDVTKGKNNEPPNKWGFSAIPGWDAATGLGTPDYEALSKVVKAL